MIRTTAGTLLPGCRLLARTSSGNRSVAHHGLLMSMSHIPTMGSGSTTGATITSFRHHFSFLASKQIRLQPTSRFYTLISSSPSHSLRNKRNNILSRAIAQQFSSSTPSPSTATSSDSAPPSSDALPTSLQPGTWLDRMPKSIQPYLYLTRIDKPIGTWLLLWPCSKGIISLEEEQTKARQKRESKIIPH